MNGIHETTIFHKDLINHIMEIAQSSTYGKSSICNAIDIVRALCSDVPIFTLKRVSGRRPNKKFQSFRTDNEFFEGWIVFDGHPNDFSFIAVPSIPCQCGTYFPTLTSVDGQPKTKYPLPVNMWVNYQTLSAMFQGAQFTYSNGRVSLNNKEQMRKQIQFWEEQLNQIDGCIMSYVLELHYSVSELRSLYHTPHSQMEQWIDELEALLKVGKKFERPNFKLPFLAKGLTGNHRAIRLCVRARVAFWREWNLHRDDILIRAETYRPASGEFLKAA
ncbi:hypothetical protein [Vibrio rotiferianus]|uniref:hypothetical protein n=1 Tax=Vibrio rotiferianus TaxID=190895 RepID=UPI000B59DCFE|nr:hypothetical protein [Vibrio rotiferianus]ASI96559.1 hypothetical protein BSZ04_16540 [Vibrio rotiferianus]